MTLTKPDALRLSVLQGYAATGRPMPSKARGVARALLLDGPDPEQAAALHAVLALPATAPPVPVQPSPVLDWQSYGRDVDRARALAGPPTPTDPDAA